MKITFDKEERKSQKEILKQIFQDYSAIHHDVFVCRYNKIQEELKISDYMIQRGLKKA